MRTYSGWGSPTVDKVRLKMEGLRERSRTEFKVVCVAENPLFLDQAGLACKSAFWV
jgi:hypothetical protein